MASPKRTYHVLPEYFSHLVRRAIESGGSPLPYEVAQELIELGIAPECPNCGDALTEHNGTTYHLTNFKDICPSRDVEQLARNVVETYYSMRQQARLTTPHELYESIKALSLATKSIATNQPRPRTNQVTLQRSVTKDLWSHLEDEHGYILPERDAAVTGAMTLEEMHAQDHETGNHIHTPHNHKV